MSGIIQLENLSRTYCTGDVEVHAVRGISLEIQPGEMVAIMGASGSGKSTLMNTLGCLDKPTSGHYLLDGATVGNMDRDALAGHRNRTLGFVFQSFNLLSRTSALENVELPLLYASPHPGNREQRKRAIKALEIVGLSNRSGHYPNQLSGGQQQRVAIARALVNDPKLLLADEPTGNLDTQTSMEIMEIFQNLNRKGMTIVMVTHELDIARFCLRQIVMRDGCIVKDQLIEDRLDAATERKQLHIEQDALQLAP